MNTNIGQVENRKKTFQLWHWNPGVWGKKTGPPAARPRPPHYSHSHCSPWYNPKGRRMNPKWKFHCYLFHFIAQTFNWIQYLFGTEFDELVKYLFVNRTKVSLKLIKSYSSEIADSVRYGIIRNMNRVCFTQEVYSISFK